MQCNALTTYLLTTGSPFLAELGKKILFAITCLEKLISSRI